MKNKEELKVVPNYISVRYRRSKSTYTMATAIFLVLQLCMIIGTISAQSCENGCNPCKVFSTGHYEGTWMLKNTTDWRCTDSCLYQRTNDSTEMCFCDPGTIQYEVCTEQESTTNPPPVTTAPTGVVYVAHDNALWCGDEAIKDETECGVAASSLGHSGQVNTMYNPNFPAGCLEDSGSLLFNDVSGPNHLNGNSYWKSLCRKAE